MSDNADATTAGISRRKILIGAAWAAPAIAIAASAPAHAAASGQAGVLVNNTIYGSVRSDLNYVFRGGIAYRHGGPYSGVVAGISSLYTIIEIPNSIYDNSRTPSISSGAGWIITDLGNSSGTRRIRLDYGSSLAAANDQSTVVIFDIPVKSSNYSGKTLTAQSQGTSAGTTVYADPFSTTL